MVTTSHSVSHPSPDHAGATALAQCLSEYSWIFSSVPTAEILLRLQVLLFLFTKTTRSPGRFDSVGWSIIL